MTTTAITPPPVLPTTTNVATTSPGSLSSSDFMNLMLKQLQNQDPLNPTDSNQLLQQISQISTLQSNQTLQTSLTSMTLQQSIGAAGNLIGKAVTGIDATGNNQSGSVKSVQVQNQQVNLILDSGATLPMSNVETIAPATVTSSTATGATSGASNVLTSLAGALSQLGFG